MHLNVHVKVISIKDTHGQNPCNRWEKEFNRGVPLDIFPPPKDGRVKVTLGLVVDGQQAAYAKRRIPWSFAIYQQASGR